MYKNMMQAFIEDIHTAKNDTDVKLIWNTVKNFLRT